MRVRAVEDANSVVPRHAYFVGCESNRDTHGFVTIGIVTHWMRMDGAVRWPESSRPGQGVRLLTLRALHK
jgi:hypothetical protein